MQGSSGNVMYVALKIKVMNDQVNVISYIQSGEYSEIMSMMGFNDNQMFSYPCGNLHNQCVKAFVRMASRINVCQPDPMVQKPVFMNHGQSQRHRRKRRNRIRKQKRKLRRKMKKMIRKMNDEFDDLSELNDTPFTDVNATIQVSNDQGDMFHVGSAGPN
jgi:hypothetical protein